VELYNAICSPIITTARVTRNDVRDVYKI